MKSVLFAALAGVSASAVASPFATEVLSYNAGSNANGSLVDPNSALGSAARMTGGGNFVSGVTPFNPPFNADQIVSIGTGGHLTLGFDRAITDSPNHRFGIDLILFGNAFFVDQSFFDGDPSTNGSGVLGPNPSMFASNGVADVYVSADGVDWRLAATTTVDLFPTLGYADFDETTPSAPGQIETDFTRAMDPSLGLSDLADLTFAQLIDLYDGSGGGIGVDISGTGLDVAHFVRIENNSDFAFNIDAVSVVPAPGAGAVLGLGLLTAARRRRA